MHDHGKNDDGMKGMMWMMVICCAIPLLLILVLGARAFKADGSTWIVFGVVTIMVLAHFFMMGSHKHSDSTNEEKTNINEESKDEKKKDGSGHGCCH